MFLFEFQPLDGALRPYHTLQTDTKDTQNLKKSFATMINF